MQSAAETPGREFARRLLSESRHPSSHLALLLASIRMEKRTGKLEVHFSKGSPNGTVTFTERKE